MIVWFVIVGVVLIAEGVAIATKEKHFPTFSRATARLLKLEDASYDKHEIKVRVIFGFVLGVFFIWAWIHLVGFPCALGIC